MSKIKFKAKLNRCVWTNGEYYIYAMDIDRNKYPDVKVNKYGNVSICGNLFELLYDTEYEITAEETNWKYGISYNVLNIYSDLPNTKDDILTFLSQILTENQAKTIISEYPNIIDIINEDRTSEIDCDKLYGIGEYTLKIIINKIKNSVHLLNLVAEFKGAISMAVIKKLYDKYSSVEAVRDKLQKEPYKALCGISGIGFKKADSILLSIEESGIVKFNDDLRTSADRCLASLQFLLEENENSGSTKANLANIRKQCIDLTKECSHHFVDIIKDESIYYDKNKMEIALKRTFDTEKYISKFIREALDYEGNKWDFDVSKYYSVNGIQLSSDQTKTLSHICNNNICIISGYAGSGKSFSTQAVISMLKDNNKSYALIAPTGKAAKVLTDYTGIKAGTIHRFLGYKPGVGFALNEYNKTILNALIIDEFSMVDSKLFYCLLKAVDYKKTKILLIGDNAQLTSVGMGNLLHDFINSDIIPTAVLTKIFRYNDGGLMKVATDTRSGRKFLNKTESVIAYNSDDYTFIKSDEENTLNTIVSVYKKMIDNGYNIDDIQVLSAKNVGECGSIQLNNVLQRVANKNNINSSKFIEVNSGGNTVKFYRNDIVIQKQNNYKALLYSEDFGVEEDCFVANGETGIIKDIVNGNTKVIIDFDGIEVIYDKADLNNVGLGYSISIHKSQGSASKVIILVTPRSHSFMLNNNLLYVGMTRAREKCIHIGNYNIVNLAIKKRENLLRNTFIRDFLAMSDDDIKNL